MAFARAMFGMAAALIATTAVGDARAATLVGVDEVNNLVFFDSSAPGVVTRTVGITGAPESLAAIDYRPINNLLYGLGFDRRIYTIDTGTGAATAVSQVLTNLAGNEFAFDFNPTIDRLRIVTNTNENYVFNPNDGSLSTTTPVFYAAGDVNAGRDPDVVASAYTSSTFGAPAGSTQLYSIDTRQGVLTRQANSAGTLQTVGPLGATLGSRTSFDILGNDAFVQNGRRLYSVDLGTGALTQVGLTDRALFGLAIVDPVPEPATWAMMILGFGAVGIGLRQRRSVRYRTA